jgi:hypothetical protein
MKCLETARGWRAGGGGGGGVTLWGWGGQTCVEPTDSSRYLDGNVSVCSSSQRF